MIPDKYVVIDIETTGFSCDNDRIIEIAAISYEKECKIAEFHTLVDPCTEIPRKVTNLTGITQADVEGAPKLSSVKESFLEFISDQTIVGHNIRTFDIPFLCAQLEVNLENPLIDTLDLSRDVFHNLSCHKLAYLCKVLHLKNAGSHRALNDVKTTHLLFVACQHPDEYDELVQEECRHRALIDLMKKEKKQQYFSQRVNIHDIKPSCDNNLLSGPLCGKLIVFTGALSMPRAQAMQLAVDAGAILKSSVSQKTAFLVVGSQDADRVGEDGMSTKEEKAYALNASGKANIRIISEEEFLKLATKEGTAV